MLVSFLVWFLICIRDESFGQLLVVHECVKGIWRRDGGRSTGDFEAHTGDNKLLFSDLQQGVKARVRHYYNTNVISLSFIILNTV